MLNYFNNKRKTSVNFLFLKFKFITIYDVNFKNILKIHRVIKINNEKLKN